MITNNILRVWSIGVAPSEGSSELGQDALKIGTINSRLNFRELALYYKSCQTSVCRPLKKVEKTSKSGVWIPHMLSEDT